MPLIDPKNIPRLIRNEFAAALVNDHKWEERSFRASKDRLVAFLMKAQNSRCAYCRRLIKDELGHRELDHILPKGAAGKPANATRNVRTHRRSTLGYSQYRFAPKNLALTCKRCNHRKGSYDCRADRSISSTIYPTRAEQFEWIHPYFHEYSEHITIKNDFVFQEVLGSNGSIVIEECNLTGVAVLEARARDLWLHQIKDPTKLTLKLLLDGLADLDIVDSVAQRFPSVPRSRVGRLVKALQNNRLL